MLGIIIFGLIVWGLYVMIQSECNATDQTMYEFFGIDESKREQKKKARDEFKLNAQQIILLAHMKKAANIDELKIRERMIKNPGKIEHKYREKNRIPDEQRLYAPEYINEDFFNFYLDYILNDSLFDNSNIIIEETGQAPESEKKNETTPATERKKEKTQKLNEAICNRLRSDFGISNNTFERRVYLNSKKLEEMYRKQKHITDGRQLVNRQGYVDDDLFAFILGYVVTNHLFNDDDIITTEITASHIDEVEYEHVNLWESETSGVSGRYNHDELDFDELEMMDEWERREALEAAGLDPDDFELEFDSDYSSGSDYRNVTFQDDFGFNGDDMYSFDGEFIEG